MKDFVIQTFKVGAASATVPGLADPMKIAGTFFYILSINGDPVNNVVNVRAGASGDFVTYGPNTGKHFDEPFDRLEFQNKVSAVALTVVIAVGFSRFVDNRTTEGLTSCQALKDGVMAAGEAVQAPNPSTGQIKFLVVSNLDAVTELYIETTTASGLCIVMPKTTEKFPTSQALQVRNRSGGNVTAVISQIIHIRKQY